MLVFISHLLTIGSPDYSVQCDVPIDSGSEQKSRNSSSKKIIAFSLYGDNHRYLVGALENAILVKEVYPDGWTMRVYHDLTVPADLLQSLRRLDVETVDMTRSQLANRMCWRFLVASEPGISRFISRDIDSRLSHREAHAVRAWSRSAAPFHIMS